MSISVHNNFHTFQNGLLKSNKHANQYCILIRQFWYILRMNDGIQISFAIQNFRIVYSIDWYSLEILYSFRTTYLFISNVKNLCIVKIAKDIDYLTFFRCQFMFLNHPLLISLLVNIKVTQFSHCNKSKTKPTFVVVWIQKRKCTNKFIDINFHVCTKYNMLE